MCIYIHDHIGNNDDVIHFSSFSSLLTSLLWPLSSSAISSRDLNRWDEDKGLFSELFINLMKLDTSHHNGDVVKTHDMPLPLPLEVMVSPLRKRFRYHFMENRKTNNPEKVILINHSKA